METVQIIKVGSETAALEAAQQIYKQLENSPLFSSEPCLLLLSGGSCIEVALEFIKLVPKEKSLNNLTVALADERWLDPSSKDSNEQQLRNNGVINLFEIRGAHFESILGTEQDPHLAADILEEKYADLLSNSRYTVLLAGIGSDGHTVGMLPHPIADTFQDLFSTPLHIRYYRLDSSQNNPFNERITVTLSALAKIDSVFVFATGEAKIAAVMHLKQKDQPIHLLPALGLYLSKKELTLLTDVSL